MMMATRDGGRRLVRAMSDITNAESLGIRRRAGSLKFTLNSPNFSLKRSNVQYILVEVKETSLEVKEEGERKKEREKGAKDGRGERRKTRVTL
jgi:hypothetical protein